MSEKEFVEIIKDIKDKDEEYYLEIVKSLERNKTNKLSAYLSYLFLSLNFNIIVSIISLSDSDKLL